MFENYKIFIRASFENPVSVGILSIVRQFGSAKVVADGMEYKADVCY
jgi:hypothetical protein